MRMKFPQSDTFIRPLTVLIFCDLCPFLQYKHIKHALASESQSYLKMSRKHEAYAEVTTCVTIWTDSQPGGQMDVALAATLMGSLGW